MAELVELRHVVRTDITGQRGKHLADGDSERLRFRPVDHDRVLRRAGAKRRRQPLETGLRIAVGNDGVGEALEKIIVEIAVADFDLHREAAHIADALDRGRQHREREGLGDRLQGAVDLPLDRFLILALFLEPRVPILHHDEGDAGVGEARAIVENRDAADGHDMFDARHRLDKFLDLVQHRVRAFLRGAVRQLRDDDHVTLIFGRQESGRHAGQRPDGESDESQRHGDHQQGVVRHAAHEPNVAVLRRVIDPVEAAVEEIALSIGRRWAAAATKPIASA